MKMEQFSIELNNDFCTTDYQGRLTWASLTAQLVKNLPAMQETLVPFLGWEDPLEKEQATHSSIFLGFPGGSACKESACIMGDQGSVPGLGRSPGEGNVTHSNI